VTAATLAPTRNGTLPEAVARPRRVILYARVSGAEQKRNETVKPQLALLRGLAEGRSSPDLPPHERVTVVDTIIDEGQSGTLPLGEREQGARLLRLVADGMADEVWITKLDRIARNLRLLLDIHDRLHDHGVALVAHSDGTDTSTYNGRLVFHVLGAIAEWERERIEDRTTEGRAAKAAEGRSMGGAPPFGYRLDAARRFALDDTFIPEAGMTACKLVRWMFERVGNDGWTAERVAAQLTAWGVPLTLRHYTLDPTKRGKGTNHRPDGRWIGARVLHLLHRPHFKGDGVYGASTPVAFACPALVEPALWARAQAQITRNKKLAKRNAPRPYLLSGLICCGTLTADGTVCGRNYTRLVSSHDTPYYRGCAVKSYDRQCDCRRHVPAEALDEAVWAAVCDLLRSPGVALAQAQARLDARRRAGPALDAQLQALGVRLGELDAERERTLLLFRKGHISESEADRTLAEIAGTRAEVERERGALTSQHRVTDVLEARLSRAGSRLGRWREMVEEIDQARDPERMRKLVEDVVTEVTITYWYDADGCRHRKAEVRLELGELFAVDLSASSRS
jgi:site-specific DNA recombinase